MDIPLKEADEYHNHPKEHSSDYKNKTAYYKFYHHKAFNTDCHYGPVFESYISDSLFQLTELAKPGFKIYNCTEGGAIEGEGIECMKFEDYLNGKRRI